jgi:bacterioferritin-associated ferredoxin
VSIEPTADDLESEVCFCNKVTKRKLVNFIRQRRPTRVEQLGECLGAGTTCGMCRSRMRAIFLAETQPPTLPAGQGMPIAPGTTTAESL